MSVSSSTIRQGHTVLGGNIRYETAELILLTIPNFEMKQKGHYAFVQEIQEALDEQQNNFDSLINRNQYENRTLAEPFAFESQIDTDTYPLDLSFKSTDESNQQTLNQSENNQANESIPILGAPDEINRTNNEDNQPRKPSWTLTRNISNIKKEAITPPKSKRRQSKTSVSSRDKSSSSNSTMRQMTMTQLFDPIESSRSKNNNSTFIKNEPNTPSADTTMFMPESLIGLAQPSESISDIENDQNNFSDQMASMLDDSIFRPAARKRKSIPSPIVTHNNHDDLTEDEETDIQNEAIIETPYEGIDSEELLYACPMCRNYWLGLPEELRRKENLTCRHRQKPAARTPEHFWSLGIPNTQTCIQRGYGGVLPSDQPVQRPRRPRRQYHRRLQQQQQQQQLNESDDDLV